MDNKYIGIVRNVETIKGKNLGQLTLDYLMDSVKNFVNGEAILEGNLPLLQVIRSSTIISYLTYITYCTGMFVNCFCCHADMVLREVQSAPIGL